MSRAASPSCSTYQEISGLTSVLRNESKITARRDAARRMVHLLSDARARQRLSRECFHVARSGFCGSRATDGHAPLRQVWRLLINAAVHASERTMAGKSKLTAEDVVLPFKLLQKCNADDSELGLRAQLYQPQCFTFDSFFRYRRTNSASRTTKLGPREVCALLAYCLSALSNEAARLVAEPDLMAMLLTLCSRPDHVVHFHPKQDLSYILSELHPRFLLGPSPTHSLSAQQTILINSAKAFASLVYQSATQLGIGMHIFVQPCISMVSEWCRLQIHGTPANTSNSSRITAAAAASSIINSSSKIIPYMFSALTTLLAWHPQQSLVPMADSGKHIIGYAKRCFGNARGKSRDAIIEYFSAHLLLCEVAGHVQGLMLPLDLGSLGSASLGPTQVQFLLSMLMSSTELERLSEPASTSAGDDTVIRGNAKSLSVGSAIRKYGQGKKSRKGVVSGTGHTLFWTPLVKRQRRYLELCARLLKCAQRHFLADAEFQLLLKRYGSPAQALIAERDTAGISNYTGLGSNFADIVAPEILSSCPWVRFVGQFLRSGVASGTFLSAAAGSEGRPSSCSEQNSQHEINGPPHQQQFSIMEELPLLSAANIAQNAKSASNTTAPASIVPYLQLTCACAEAFPRGECWSSTNRWKRIPAKGDDGVSESYCTACLPRDVASIVYSLASILEENGSPGGDQNVQMWALLCLLKFTESSAIVCRYWDQSSDYSSIDILARVWERVWLTVFRPDLRYSSYTLTAFPSSLGNMVLSLLTEIVRNCCTTPHLLFEISQSDERLPPFANQVRTQQHASFLFTNQTQVWNLPIFKDARQVNSSAVFELASILVQIVGLSDNGADEIGSQMPSIFGHSDVSRGRIDVDALKTCGRRYRLACFCLQYVEHVLTSNNEDLLKRTIPFASAFYSSLIGECGALALSTYSMEAFRSFQCTEDIESPGDFNLSRPPTAAIPTTLNINLLWEDSVLPFGSQFYVDSNDHLWRRLHGRDAPLSLPSSSQDDRIWLEKRRDCSRNTNFDFVTVSLARILQNFAIDRVEHVCRRVAIVEADEDENGHGCDSANLSDDSLLFSSKTFAIQFLLTIVCSKIMDDFTSLFWRSLTNVIKPLLEKVVLKWKEISLRSDEFSYVGTNILGIVRILTNVFSISRSSSVANLFSDVIKSLYDECREILDLYRRHKQAPPRDSAVASYLENAKASNGQSNSDDDDFYAKPKEFNSENCSLGSSAEDSDDSLGSQESFHIRKRRLTNHRNDLPKRVRLGLLKGNAHGPRDHPPTKYCEKTVDDEAAVTEERGVWLCAGILAVISPSSDCCKFVADCLVWPYDTSASTDYENVILDSSDPHDSLLCLSMFCCRSAVINRDKVTNESPSKREPFSVMSLCTKMILSGRSCAEFSSPFYMFGFRTAEALMAITDTDEDECADVIEVLHPDGSKTGQREELRRVKRSLRNRPRLHSVQIQAATKSFLHGNKYFHESFDSVFALSFVIPSLSDISCDVGNAAVSAVAAALALLPCQKKIVDDALHALPPLVTNSNADVLAAAFTEWSQTLHSTSSNEIAAMESRAWQESRLAQEARAFECRAVLSGSTSNFSLSLDILTDFIKLSAARPCLQALCFRSIERVAVLQRYRSVEDMLNHHREALLQEWISSGRQLSEIPIAFCAPGILRACMRIGRTQDFHRRPFDTATFKTNQNQDEAVETTPPESEIGPLNDAFLDILRIQDDSVCEYVGLVAASLIPLILLLSDKEANGGKQSAKAAHLDQVDIRRESKHNASDRRWQYLEEASAFLTGGCTDADIAKILRAHLHDIYAFVFPMLQDNCCDEDVELVQRKGSDVLRFITGCVSEDVINRQGARNSHLVVLELLRLSGKGLIFFDDITLNRSAYAHAIKYVAEQLKGRDKESGSNGVFQDAGGSTTEYLLHAKKWLEDSAHELQRQQSWNVIEFICNEVLNEVTARNSLDPQIGFTLHVLIGIAQCEPVCSLRSQVLSTLKSFTSALLEQSVLDRYRAEIENSLNTLCAAMFQIHDQSQRAFINFWKKFTLVENATTRCCRGLMTFQPASLESCADARADVWDWNDSVHDTLGAQTNCIEIFNESAAMHADHVDHDATDSMIVTFKILNLILVQKRARLGECLKALDPFPSSSLSDAELNVLSQRNIKFSLQSFLNSNWFFESSTVDNGIGAEIDLFLTVSKRLLTLHTGNADEPQLSHKRRREKAEMLRSSSLSYLASLEKIRESLRNLIRRDIQEICCNQELTTKLYSLLRELFSLCGSQVPHEIKISASFCLGEFALLDFKKLSFLDLDSMGWNDCSFASAEEVGNLVHNNLLSLVQTKALELLATRFLQSDDVDTAIVAKNTIKALLRTKEGLRCLKSIKRDDINRVLRPFRSDKKLSRLDIPQVSDEFYDNLLHSAGETRESAKNNPGWCWSNKLWTCLKGESTSFEAWITNVVCAVIMCCYGDERQADQKNAHVSGEFFLICTAICAREPDFASTVFPIIVYDVLNSDQLGDEHQDTDQRALLSMNSAVLKDSAVGAPFSFSNQALTRCFSKVIAPFQVDASNDTLTDCLVGHKASIESDPKAVATIVKVLELLRYITEHRFLSSSAHKRNPSSLSSRTYPDQHKSKADGTAILVSQLGDDSYNEGLEPAPVWRGVPYGTVLHLSGIDVALACLSAKFYPSALYYAEMYAENSLGGAGCILERLSSPRADFVQKPYSCYSISGFGVPIDSGFLGAESNRVALTRALAFQGVLQNSFSHLREPDSLKGVEAQGRALRFGLKNQENISLCCRSGPDDIRLLVDLDTKMQVESSTSGCNYEPDVTVEIATSLENLGLRHLLRFYVAGLSSSCRTVSSHDCDKLKEKWFGDTWRNFSWDDSLMPITSADDPSSYMSASDPQSFSLVQNTFSSSPLRFSVDRISNSAVGFNEALSNLFYGLLKQDPECYHSNLMTARLTLLKEMNSSIGLESVLSGVSDFAVRLKTLTELGELGNAIFGQTSVTDLLQSWGFCVGVKEMVPCDNNLFLKYDAFEISFPALDFAMSAREVALRILHQKYGSSVGPSVCSHLWTACSVALQCGKPNIAYAALSRLRRCLDLLDLRETDAASELHVSMRLCLLEATILRCRGEAKSAIRAVTLIIGSLRQFRAQNKEVVMTPNDVLLAEALLLGGVWLIGNKIDSARAVLKEYLQPAAKLANELYSLNSDSSSAKLLSSANFTLGDFVSSLYDSGQKRMNSHEWKVAGLAAADRCLELARCEEMFRESRRKLMDIEAIATKGRLKGGRQKTSTPTPSKEELEHQRKEFQDIHIHMRTLQREVEMDTKERSSVEDSVVSYLRLAIESYGAALSTCNPTSDRSQHVFRLISLWFDNSHRTDEKGNVNAIMSAMAGTIPSFRFVPLAYQIFSRIDAAANSTCPLSETNPTREPNCFQDVLRKIVSKICIEHPYHALVQLIALSNGNKVGTGVGGRQASIYLDNVGATKVQATSDLLDNVRRTGPQFVSNLVDSYIALVDSYIDLAMAPTETFNSGGIVRTKDIPLASVRSGKGRGSSLSLDRCLGSPSRSLFPCPPCVLTQFPPLRPACDYGNGEEDPIGAERIAGFYDTFSLTETGIHRPRIVVCKGSRGGAYKQLVKGEDDIRQDAVMQQVFMTVNNLLKQQSKTTEIGPIYTKVDSGANGEGRDVGCSTRHLKVVTYSIVPLSPASGVLEWVNDTIPFGDYLLDKGRTKGDKGSVGAHSKYYPGEWGNSLCRMHFRNAPANAKRDAFDEVCKHFSPAFRFFFLERFSRSPQAWHAARMSYVRSCAVNSIVGHILGIGDRHSHNILVCERTGEVVHIDFGIVFEQGKCLTTPETVPFRLTRDIVDGMGPLGTEGPFTAAAEQVLSVLRENASSLLTILSAVVSDPLYKWCVSPVKARQRQQDGDFHGEEQESFNTKRDRSSQQQRNGNAGFENENDAANRALAKISEKLQGYEEGTSGERQSIEGQVQMLISAAKDPDNLCSLYFGWCPWL